MLAHFICTSMWQPFMQTRHTRRRWVDVLVGLVDRRRKHTHTLIHINENAGKGYFKVDGQRGEQNKYALRKRTVYFTTRRNI